MGGGQVSLRTPALDHRLQMRYFIKKTSSGECLYLTPAQLTFFEPDLIIPGNTIVYSVFCMYSSLKKRLFNNLEYRKQNTHDIQLCNAVIAHKSSNHSQVSLRGNGIYKNERLS